MTLDNLKHSAILTTLFKMADDNDLIGASEFIKGEFKFRRMDKFFAWVTLIQCAASDLFQSSDR